MALKGGVKKVKEASWGGEPVQFDGDVIGFGSLVAWQYNDSIDARKATCSTSPTKRCD